MYRRRWVSSDDHGYAGRRGLMPLRRYWSRWLFADELRTLCGLRPVPSGRAGHQLSLKAASGASSNEGDEPPAHGGGGRPAGWQGFSARVYENAPPSWALRLEPSEPSDIVSDRGLRAQPLRSPDHAVGDAEQTRRLGVDRPASGSRPKHTARQRPECRQRLSSAPRSRVRLRISTHPGRRPWTMLPMLAVDHRCFHLRAAKLRPESEASAPPDLRAPVTRVTIEMPG
jgi:hypothetical protein